MATNDCSSVLSTYRHHPTHSSHFKGHSNPRELLLLSSLLSLENFPLSQVIYPVTPYLLASYKGCSGFSAPLNSPKSGLLAMLDVPTKHMSTLPCTPGQATLPLTRAHRISLTHATISDCKSWASRLSHDTSMNKSRARPGIRRYF